MNLYNKKYLYANGSSVTAGGGFEDYQYRNDIRDLYEKKGVDLPITQTECSYPKFIADELGLTLINEAKNGSGIDRLVRTTFDWILNNSEKLNETIILLEPQVGIRLDWYVNEWEEYGIINAHRNEKGEFPFTLVRDWFRSNWDEQHEINQRHKKLLDDYFLNFFNAEEQNLLEIRKLILLVSYLNDRKIDYLITLPQNFPHQLEMEIQKLIPFDSNLIHVFGRGVWSYTYDNKLLISDEIDHTDNHIGYFGNQIVAKKIVDFIKKNKTIYYYSISSDLMNTSTQNYLCNNTSINFERVFNSEKADFIFLSDLSIFYFRECIEPYCKVSINEFKNNLIKIFPLLKNIDVKDKRFLISLSHERVSSDHYVKFLKFLETELNIKKSQIWFIDVSSTNYPLTNHVPLEVKIRQFSGFEYKNYIDNHFRNKKIICLNNKCTIQRLVVFDRILHAYGNSKTMKDENLISFLLPEDINFQDYDTEISFKHDFLNDFSIYKNNEIQFPWKLDMDSIDPPYAHANNLLPQLVEYYKDSIITISSETERVFYLHTDLYDNNNFNVLRDMQFSEKSILPIIGGSFLFSIVDGSFYRNLENIGFDFSYLKDIFDIDYLTNTPKENIEEVTKLVDFVKNKSIQDLNSFRENNYHYIKHNRKLMLDILFGDYNDTSMKFWERLSGKKLR